MPFKRGQLLYFVTIVDEGQLTRAAAKLEIAQPTLSRAISLLESELGVKLLERGSRGVTLTPAGKVFYEAAARAVRAASDATEVARSLARAEVGTIAFGFLGRPPAIDSPRNLEEFRQAHPRIDIQYQELRFPSTPTSAWLSEVDVAVCHRPPADRKVWARTLRLEPRAVLAPTRHRLAERSALTVEEVIDECFIGFHPSVDAGWAGFWSLDDHRGGPPSRRTSDRAANPQEVLAALAVRNALTIVPSSTAGLLASVLPGLAAIPLRGAEPAAPTLVGHEDRRNPLVSTLLEFADSVVASWAGETSTEQAGSQPGAAG